MNRLDEIRERVKNIYFPYLSHWDNPENTRKAYGDDICFLLKKIDSLEKENEDLVKLSEKMNVCDLVKENLRLSNTIQHLETDNNFLQLKVNSHTKLLAENAYLKKELEQYQQAEQEGLLIKLPCKVGDKVYIADGGITHAEVTEIIIGEETRYCIKYMEDSEPMVTTFRKYNIGWDVFLSEEEVEATLTEVR